jgi:hypothetical protein
MHADAYFWFQALNTESFQSLIMPWLAFAVAIGLLDSLAAGLTW